MSPQTSTSASAKTPLALGGMTMPSGRQIFDALMSKIEPELVTANLAHLDAPYKNESPAEKKQRYKRYTAAFKQYKKDYKAWSLKLNKAVQAYKKALFRAAEKVTERDEENALALLESQMLTA